MNSFDLDHYLKKSTESSAVALRVKNKSILQTAARLISTR